MQGAQVRSLVGEVRSHMLCGTAKKIKKIKKKKEKGLQGTVQMEGFTDRRGWKKEDSSKKGLFWARLPSFRGKVGSVKQISSLMLPMLIPY